MRLLLVAVIAVAAVVVGVEVAAVPVAEATLASELEDAGADAEDLVVTGLRRPASLGVVTGRARDVEVVVDGLDLGGWRIERAEAFAPEVELPWSRGAGDLPPARVEATAVQEDLQAGLRDRAPFGLAPTLELSPGTARLGVESVPRTLELAVEVTDGVLRVGPGGEVPAWFAALGLDLEFELPGELRIDDVEVAERAVVTRLELDVHELGSGSGARPLD